MLQVLPQDAATLWPKIEGYVRQAIGYGSGKLEPWDWLARVLVGQADLFVSAAMDMVVIGEAQEFPRRRIYVVAIAAGEHNGEHNWDDITRTVEMAARARNCSAIEASGRPGWLKHAEARGYSLTCQTWKREL